MGSFSTSLRTVIAVHATRPTRWAGLKKYRRDSARPTTPVTRIACADAADESESGTHSKKRQHRPCLVHPKNNFFQDSLSNQILRHVHETLNIDERKLIVQFTCKSQNESVESS